MAVLLVEQERIARDEQEESSTQNPFGLGSHMVLDPIMQPLTYGMMDPIFHCRACLGDAIITRRSIHEIDCKVFNV